MKYTNHQNFIRERVPYWVHKRQSKGKSRGFRIKRILKWKWRYKHLSGDKEEQRTVF